MFPWKGILCRQEFEFIILFMPAFYVFIITMAYCMHYIYFF